MELSYIGRRVLGHLPVWVEDEDARISAQTEAGGFSVISYTAAEMTHERLGVDPGTPDMTEAQVEQVLTELADQGLCVEEDGNWKMTQAGLAALEEVKPQSDQQEVGPAFVELHPAQSVADAEGA